MHEDTIRVECAMTNPPKPIGYAVFNADGKPVAYLSWDDIEVARAEFIRKEKAHATEVR